MTVKITNETPWDTNDLVKFLTPLVEGMNLTEVKVQTIQAQPGVKREEQSPAAVGPVSGGWYFHSGISDAIVVYLLSPKRADKATETLSRLSLVADIQPHEAALPESAIARIEHALAQLRTWAKEKARNPGHQVYDVVSCFRGDCKHKVEVKTPVLVKGNTKARIKDPVTADQIERKLRWAQHHVDQCQEELNEAIEKRDRLQVRLDKLRQKER